MDNNNDTDNNNPNIINYFYNKLSRTKVDTINKPLSDWENGIC